ncbi:hypothetical protein BHE74_00008891 [Ensete ventricosum]|uniref:Uncharacterized protein n=1 Tax=Ensete ventricosum TaxID=4639 RepID=A0A427AFI1_ENSVE|nr:hypothetical protein B296_00016218 [Ensete ventricosum]RWW29412.1 hypothetical protein GW17_00006071 [Ensete ventricosum]RWW82635.1 hypothetical protein BHE74_00008891 [Ensete ventricosum]
MTYPRLALQSRQNFHQTLIFGTLIHRLTYSKMSEELCNLLVSTPGMSSTPVVRMSCFDTMLSAPIPEDLRSNHLQNALAVFTYQLLEAST